MDYKTHRGEVTNTRTQTPCSVRRDPAGRSLSVDADMTVA